MPGNAPNPSVNRTAQKLRFGCPLRFALRLPVTSNVRALRMEEPISFYLWGKIIPERRKEAIDFIRQQSVFPSEVELRKAVMASISNDQAIQISAALGLSRARTLEATAGNVFHCFTLCQEGYGPAGKEAYCSVHNLHFGGCLGCHICSGFYRE